MDTDQPQIIILHGLGRTPRSMHKLTKQFKAQGFRVFAPSYNGLMDNYQDILQSLDERISQWVDEEQAVNFVGHSFGGILIRGLLDKNPQWNKGRCVMIGTPNKGTRTASFMLSRWWSKYFVPKVTADLTPDSALMKSLPEPSIETGIIAGNVNFHLFIPISWYFKKATEAAIGDGVVELVNTKVDNMTDFIIMPLHHSFMTLNLELVEQAAHFIVHGRFGDEYQAVEPK